MPEVDFCFFRRRREHCRGWEKQWHWARGDTLSQEDMALLGSKEISLSSLLAWKVNISSPPSRRGEWEHRAEWQGAPTCLRRPRRGQTELHSPVPCGFRPLNRLLPEDLTLSSSQPWKKAGLMLQPRPEAPWTGPSARADPISFPDLITLFDKMSSVTFQGLITSL